jgi:hypothetical protein
MPSALFVLVVLQRGYCFLPGTVWIVILLFSIFHCSLDDRCMPPGPAFFHWDGGWFINMFAQGGLEQQSSQSQPPKWLRMTGTCTPWHPGLMMLLSSTMSLLISCLLDLSISDKGVLKSQIITVGFI